MSWNGLSARALEPRATPTGQKEPRQRLARRRRTEGEMAIASLRYSSTAGPKEKAGVKRSQSPLP